MDKNLKRMIQLIFLSIAMIACNGAPTEEEIDNALGLDLPGTFSIQDGSCFEDTHSTPEEFITRKLDILIVQDTSGSIQDERANIADGFDSFVDALPAEVDYQAAVMLAHGPGSSRYGTLYKKSTEPLILKSSELTTEDVKSHLRTKMQSPHTQGSSDGGEVGLLSLQNALSGSEFSDIQSQGFFREDAALVVIFVADEQDICAEYPDGVTPVPDPQGKENSSFANWCVDGSGNYNVTPQSILEDLRRIKDQMPLVVSGVLYDNNETIPLGGENEIGYGYLDTINLAGGINVDMANGDFSAGLSRIGQLATVSIQPANNFNLNTQRVDVSSIAVTVNNNPAGHEYISDFNQVFLPDARDPLSVVRINYCERDQLDRQATMIVSGALHNCALLVNGDVKCWGRNNFGQLGLGDTTNRGDTEMISDVNTVDLGGRAIFLSSGLYHSCAMLEDQSVKCWGRNNLGQLGQGNTDDIGDDELPSSIPVISLGGLARRIYSGTNHNCAVLMNNSVRCWGANNSGQLGLGNNNNIGDDELPSSTTPINLGGNVIQMDVSTVSNHNCAILDDKTVRCWGNNSSGQLGQGNTTTIGDNELPNSIPVIDMGENVKAITTGNQHTCALLESNQVKCFGSSSFGQIGLPIGTIIGDDESPSAIGNLNLGEDVIKVNAGNFTTCALLSSGSVKCWGRNSLGQLGLGNTTNNDDPANTSPITLTSQAEDISAGSNHHCVLEKDSGKPLCFGQGTFGQLGNNNTENIGDDEDLSTIDFLDLIVL